MASASHSKKATINNKALSLSESLQKAKSAKITISTPLRSFTNTRDIALSNATRIQPAELNISQNMVAYHMNDDDRWWNVDSDKPDSSEISFAKELILNNGQSVTYHRVAPTVTGGKKQFFIETAHGKQLPISHIRPDLLPLYGSEQLSTLDGKETVILCEGVPAADALRAHGLTALGTLSGITVPDDAALQALIKHDIVLWPDNDDIGVHYMANITRALRRLGASTIRVVQWTNGPRRADAADFTDGRDALHALINDATSWDPRLLHRAAKDASLNFPPSSYMLRAE